MMAMPIAPCCPASNDAEAMMPTTLPPRAALPTKSLDFKDFAKTMIYFYAVIAIPIAIILAIEYRLGMFNGMTLAELIVQATGSDSPYSHPELVGMF
jgi:hypothetical protein